jgi:hypothetical protein
MDNDEMHAILEQVAEARKEEVKRRASLRCKHCGYKVTRHGPETFHTVSGLIFCQFNGTKAEARE